jgi:hypothetical protein
LDDLENSQKLNFNHLSSSKKSDRLMKDYQDMKKNYNALNNKHTALLTFVENLHSSDEVPEVQLPKTAKKGSHKLVQEEYYFFPNFYRKKSTQKPGNCEDSKSGSVTMKNRYDKKGALSFSDSEKIIASEVQAVSSNGGLVEPVATNKKVYDNVQVDSIENFDLTEPSSFEVSGRNLDLNLSVERRNFKKVLKLGARKFCGQSLKEIAESGKHNLEQRVSGKKILVKPKRPNSCKASKPSEEDAYLFLNPTSYGQELITDAKPKKYKIALSNSSHRVSVKNSPSKKSDTLNTSHIGSNRFTVASLKNSVGSRKTSEKISDKNIFYDLSFNEENSSYGSKNSFLRNSNPQQAGFRSLNIKKVLDNYKLKHSTGQTPGRKFSSPIGAAAVIKRSSSVKSIFRNKKIEETPQRVVSKFQQ